MKTKTKDKYKSRIPGGLWKAAAGIYHRLVWLRYKTSETFSPGKMKVYCPCCGLKFKKFASGDYWEFPDYYDLSKFENVRQDVICPNCGSLPRQRILASWSNENKDLLLSKDILYFAPERSMLIWMNKNRISYKSADLFKKEADLQIDIQNTGLAKGSYDVVICNHVLEHAGDVMAALNEIKRILRPDGLLICSFPMSSRDEKVFEDPDVTTDKGRLEKYGQTDHVRLFGMKADQFMADAGFEVSSINGDDFPPEILPITAPCGYDINRLFLCRVKAE